MKQILKILTVSSIMMIFFISSALNVFAGSWLTGSDNGTLRWWYQLDPSEDYLMEHYAQGGWYWIDGDQNGIAELYYFDANGWLLTDAIAPDGSYVNSNGAWEIDGVVQVSYLQTATPIPYDLSFAPSQLHGLEVPDFIAFATDNAAISPVESRLLNGSFTTADLACEFNLGEHYYYAYSYLIPDYIQFLQSYGFTHRVTWEGYAHLEKYWNGYYVELIVGDYFYDTGGISVSINLHTEPIVYPEWFFY